VADEIYPTNGPVTVTGAKTQDLRLPIDVCQDDELDLVLRALDFAGRGNGARGSAQPPLRMWTQPCEVPSFRAL